MLGLLYDIHGNLPALDAVLADAEQAGVRRWLLGGDYAAFGAWPLETVDRLRELDAEWIRGNVDRWTLLAPDDAPKAVRGALERCRQLLGREVARDLAELKESRTHDRVLYCHASPWSDIKSFLPEPADTDAELLEGVVAAQVVFGHTHLQFTREGPDGVVLTNPGSVGIPLDGDQRAAWAIVHPDGWIEPRRTRYDHQASADAVRRRLGEDGELFARRIEQARFDVN
ncbi:MAG TPA: metallophosphoesterase family protein [Thermoleophilaceae bacterium]